MKLTGEDGGRGAGKELAWKYVGEVEQKKKNNIHTHIKLSNHKSMYLDR